ncbi:MAG: hypothetical protein JOY80_08810, partial [Candidatus Dormibacteraeota bacterium]|nr:hypothetical protein [Candidatus Dormibacteraeota bacterium]
MAVMGHLGPWAPVVAITLAALLIVVATISARLLRHRSRGVRGLLTGGLVLVAASSAVSVATFQARAAGTITLNPGSVTSALGLSTTYATVRDALNTAINGSGTSIDLPIPDLQSLSVSSAQEYSDDSKNALAVQGTVSISSVSFSVQLSAVWPSSTSTTPQVALALAPSTTSLASLNALWSNAPVNPGLTGAVLVASPQTSYTFNPTALPSAAQTFYNGMGSTTIGQGISLFATVN